MDLPKAGVSLKGVRKLEDRGLSCFVVLVANSCLGILHASVVQRGPHTFRIHRENGKEHANYY